jgi:hypothetical protein
MKKYVFGGIILGIVVLTESLILFRKGISKEMP